MVGPVLHHEMMLGSRRSRAYYFRWIYAGWLVLQVLWFWMQFGMSLLVGATNSYATPVVASWFVETFVVQQLILLVLATPVLTAGAVTDEKTRGTLQYLLTTDLLSWHIVLGKMLGRIFQVAMIALAGAPLFCFLGVFAGVEPVTLLGVAAVTLLPLCALGSASLLASVWNRHTRDAVLSLYVVGTLGLLAIWFLGRGALHYFNPLYVLEPAWGERSLPDLAEFLHRLAWATLCWGGITVVCFGLSVWRLRPAYIRQIEGEGRKKKERWWRVRRPAVPENPIPWKERHVEGLAPISTLRRIPTWLAVATVFIGTTVSSAAILLFHLPASVTLSRLTQLALQFRFDEIWQLLESAWATAVPPDEAFYLQSLLVMLIASLVVGIRCSGTICGEREKQSWEALLLTPLTSRQLVRGKLWGIIGSSYLYLFAYALPALVLSALGGIMSFFWTVIWLAVTWLAMYFVGAAGIWCSVRSKTSWRSLLGTIGIGYVGGFLVFLITTPVIAMIAVIILLFLMLVDAYLGTTLASTALGGGPGGFFLAFKVASCIGLAVLFWVLAWFFLGDAQKWIADRERTRHWKDEPMRLRPRKREVRQRFYK
jgi:ABC-type transport system involved in multi-copper enzyme maturation permease subunit